MNSLLAGVSNSTIDKNQIRILGSNIRPELLTDIIPKIDTNKHINSYPLDFYNHGGYISNYSSGAPVAFKTWWEHRYYMMGII